MARCEAAGLLYTKAQRTLIEREDEYGTCVPFFEKLAARWSQVLAVDISPEQVCLMMVDLKILRLAQHPGHADSLVDILGYSGIIAEIRATSDE